nr:MFS transporter [uncultured Arsenicibacter sp.]
MFFRALIISWGGILFGYKLAILCGINRWFRLPFTIDSVSEYLPGGLTIAGLLTGVILSWQFSRRSGNWKALVWLATLYLITAIGSSLSPDLYLLSFFIGAGGICLGGTIVTLPLYIIEAVPVSLQPRASILFSVTAVLTIQLIYMFLPVYTVNWRWIPGAEAFVAFLLMLSLFTIPDQARQVVAGQPAPAKEPADREPDGSFSDPDQPVFSGSGTSAK